MQENRLNIAVIGAGNIANLIHMPYLLKMPAARVSTIVDTDLARVEHVGGKYHITSRLRHYQDALRDKDIQVVDVCTPPFTHAELIKAAAEAGKDVIVEKPLSMTLEEAIGVKDTLQATDAKLGIVLNHRYMPLVRKVLGLVQEGALGKLQHILVISHTFPPKVQWTEHPLITRYGVLYDFLPHMLDLVTYISQGTPRKVVCRPSSDSSPTAYTLMLELQLLDEIRCLATIDASWSPSTSRRQVCFFGTERDLVVDIQDQFAYFTHGYLTPQAQMLILAQRMRGILGRVAKGTKSLRYGPLIYHRDLLRGFLEALRQGETPPVSIMDGLIHMAIIDAAIKSEQIGKEVDIECPELL